MRKKNYISLYGFYVPNLLVLASNDPGILELVSETNHEATKSFITVEAIYCGGLVLATHLRLEVVEKA